MTTVHQLCQLLESFAPNHLAEEWDNTGLLLGDPQAAVARVMTCLTLTPESVQEAVQREANLVVSHHPLPFRPLKQLTTDTVEGSMLWQLARNGVSIYSPHTAFDSAASGINASLGERLGVGSLQPLVADPQQPELGAGRIGRLTPPCTLDQFAQRVQTQLGAESIRVVGTAEHSVEQVALACGSGGSFLAAAKQAGADTMVTGEATFHNCLAAKAAGIALVLPGHYASERFAVEQLAEWLQAATPGIEVWASEQETDPLRTL